MVPNFTPEQDQYLQLQMTRAYYEGLREGVRNYAHWKDGVQYVGTTGKTLTKAIEDIDAKERDILNRFSLEKQ